RRYADAKSTLAKPFAALPNEVDSRIRQADLELRAEADTRPLHQTLDSIRATNTAAMPGIANVWLHCALAERDPTAAKNALDAHPEYPIDLGREVIFSRLFVEGLIARMRKDEGKARSAFVAARTEQEKIVQAQPNRSEVLCLLGWIDAALGRKEEA